ncbi:hypothetical protein DPEC_G00152560 [Dallia pectoralis]|uniref:Uncharacterized protein n=1 Tax=Dallia pectoralis TaxID=75939 RepID=A0ACC2GJA2_DALPE|nr:hypothetical protein DPEC_G00152560 [Dallia pectoralis]
MIRRDAALARLGIQKETGFLAMVSGLRVSLDWEMRGGFPPKIYLEAAERGACDGVLTSPTWRKLAVIKCEVEAARTIMTRLTVKLKAGNDCSYVMFPINPKSGLMN